MSVLRPGLFNGKVALVTGGGTGIGKSITQELLSLGCNVTIASRNMENLEKTANELNANDKLDIMKCNIRKEDEVK